MSQKRFCKHCKVLITGRPHKLFCSGNCRKRSSEKKQNSYASREKNNRNMRLFDSASRMARIYFKLAPFERLGLMRELIIIAREGDGKMRSILSNAYLMDDENDYGNPFRGKRGKSYGSLARECEAYCQHYWNASARDVVCSIATEPYDGVIR